MALNSLTGRVEVLNSYIVDDTIVETGLGFTPSLVIFFWNGQVGADSTGNGFQNGIGVASSSTSRFALTRLSQSLQANMVTSCAHSQTECILRVDETESIIGACDFVSMDSDGFTLKVTDVFVSNMDVSYIAFGGADLTNIKTGVFTSAGIAPTTQAITGVGFQPTLVMLFAVGTGTDAPSAAADSILSIGAMTSSDAAAWCGGSNDGSTSANAISYCKSGESFAQPNSTLGSISSRGTFSAFGVDGFTLSWIERTGSARIHYLALRGPQLAVGNLLTQTDTTTPIAVSLGFDTKALMFFSHGKVESTTDTVQAHDMLSIGVASSPSNRVARAVHDEDALATSLTTFATESDEVYVDIDETNAIVGLMDLTAMTSGFSCIMDDADPTQRFVWYIAMGDAAGGGGGGTNPRGWIGGGWY